MLVLSTLNLKLHCPIVLEAAFSNSGCKYMLAYFNIVSVGHTFV